MGCSLNPAATHVGQNRGLEVTQAVFCFLCTRQADRGFARSRLCSKVDGTTNNLVLYSTQYGMVHQKRGGMLRGLRIKREREEYVGILILHKPH